MVLDFVSSCWSGVRASTNRDITIVAVNPACCTNFKECQRQKCILPEQFVTCIQTPGLDNLFVLLYGVSQKCVARYEEPDLRTKICQTWHIAFFLFRLS